jgi:hypothetical protein
MRHPLVMYILASLTAAQGQSDVHETIRWLAEGVAIFSVIADAA